MSEEKVIRISKVLAELNISFGTAVDCLKGKGIAIEANPNVKISDDVYSVLCKEFAGDKGNKVASSEVSKEKQKEKEALRIEREKEIEEKRKHDEERLRSQEVIRAKGSISGPVHVGKIDLNPKKSTETPKPEPIVEKTPAPKAETPKEKPVVKESVQKEAPAKEAQEKVVAEKKETKPVAEIKENKVEAEAPKTEAPAAIETPVEETIATKYTKLSGATLTGQTIDLSQ
jgi:translation initiation factor IF-2